MYNLTFFSYFYVLRLLHSLIITCKLDCSFWAITVITLTNLPELESVEIESELDWV